MGFETRPLVGKQNPMWRGGKYIKEGYVVYSSGPNRGKREHRVISNENLKKHWGRELLPGEEVHHMDFKRAHNCPSNLLICGPGLHEAFTCTHASRVSHNKYQRKPILEMAAASEAAD